MLAIACVAAADERRNQRPNIVIIFADDLGYGDLGCYGAGDIPTPHIDAVADEGVRLLDFCVASSVCTPSRAALLTGAYPRRVDLTRVLHPHDGKGIAAGETTLAELVRDVGYATACFGKWHLGHKEPFLPHRHGFQETLVIPYSHDMYRGAPFAAAEWTAKWPDHVPLIRDGKTVAELRGLEQFATLTERFTAAGCDFIERCRDRPFFLYLPLTLPHLELMAPAAWRGVSKRGPHGDAVAELDGAVGRILATLARLRLGDDTIVIVSSDNGPAKVYQKPSFTGGSAGPFSGGKGTAFEGGFRVPCVIRWPGRIPAGRTSAASCTAMDILPTCAAIAGAGLPEQPIDGRDIMPLLRDPENAATPHGEFLLYVNESPVAVRSSALKLWLPKTAVLDAAEPRLYDLASDPAERVDLAAVRPADVARLTLLAERLAVPPADVRKAGSAVSSD